MASQPPQPPDTGATPAARESGAGVAVRGLRVVLPDGRVLIEDASLAVGPGEVAVLLGGSGAGKSTFARVLFERAELERDGFAVSAEVLAVDRDDLGLVPQRGALFDHLDVRGNLDVALRYATLPRDGKDASRRARDTLARVDGEDPRDGNDASREPRERPRVGDDPADWLARVGLDRALAQPGTSVARLSGGQAQRVAVARVLAGRRRVLFFDEPSVGLDPHRVRVLARVIREQVEAFGLSAIVVTHDVALAAGVADRLYLLDIATRRLAPLFAREWPGPVERADVSEADRGRWLLALERALCDHIANSVAPDSADARTLAEPAVRPPDSADARSLAEPTVRPPDSTDARSLAEPTVRPPDSRRTRRAVGSMITGVARPFEVAARALWHLPGQLGRRPRDFSRIAGRVAIQAFVRPLPFYAVVSVLIGYTVLYVISKVGGAGVRPDALLRQIGGSYVVALAPALSALLFVAASGSATNAWLGSMGLTRQTLAMRALGVDPRAYLWSPAWLALGLAYLATAAVFALGMIAGGLAVCAHYDVPDAWALVTADLIDPRPERVRYAARAAFLCWVYAWGIASDAVAKGTAHKPDADAVTRGMTAGVVASTLWVVAWELASVIAILS